ncbi:MAG: ferredoxin III, nif-specific [Candidatus Competibacter sp.]|nr:ferredoxin III, nif-specific [Candidatus Competibacter sp.]MDG4585401.1 ferredoxin III, nif-specific [Candidatus Competibacter sp.]
MGAEPNITGVTRGGTAWVPQFAVALDEGKCIGCGRCYKVCPRDVLTIVQRAVDDVDFDDDDDDDDDDSDNSFMTLTNPMDCIGCEACSRVCPKACFSHSALPLAA